MTTNATFKTLVRNVFDQLGTILIQYLPLPTIIDLLQTQLFPKLSSDLTNRTRLSIYTNTIDIEYRINLYTKSIQQSFNNTTPIHDLKIWNIHIKHTLNTTKTPTPSINELIDIQQLLIYLCFISFTKQSKHLIPLCADNDDIPSTDTPLVIDININDHLPKIKAFMNKIGNTFQHINDDEDINNFENDDLDHIVCHTHFLYVSVSEFVYIVFISFLKDFGDGLIGLDDIELIQKRALSLTSMISEDTKYEDMIDDEIKFEENGLKIYECSASDDENAMNFDFKCHAIWKAEDNKFQSIKDITNNLPPTSHNKIQFNIHKKSEKRDIEFGSYYGDNNDILKFDFFEFLRKYIICPVWLDGVEWYGSDIEVCNVNEGIVKCYNICFGLIKADVDREGIDVGYNLKFIVWKGRYKTVDELASLETYVD